MNNKGTAAIEFAIVLSVLFAFALGLVDLGRAVWVQTSLDYAAQAAARCAAIGTSCTTQTVGVGNATVSVVDSQDRDRRQRECIVRHHRLRDAGEAGDGCGRVRLFSSWPIELFRYVLGQSLLPVVRKPMARTIFIATLWALVAVDIVSTFVRVPGLDSLRLLSLPAAVAGTLYLLLRWRRRRLEATA